MKNILRKSILVLTIVFMTFTFSSCSKKENENNDKRIAVFVPGVMSGNPVYEMLVEGVKEACSEYNTTCTVLEAGTAQSEWSGKLTALAASGKYDVIISSNPSLPDLALPLTEKFPNVKFILLDSHCEGNPNIATLRYNQREQAFFAGYVAGLVTTSSELKYANSSKRIGIIAAQEYPVMNNVILPGFTEGASEVDPGIYVEFKVIGSWADAEKASELAKSLYNSGADVVLPIAGGGVQGVFSAAKELGFYITWFDDNGYSKAPGYVVSSTVIDQKKAAYEVTKDYLEDKTQFGKGRTVGIKDGYVKFIFDDENYKSTVPASIQEKVKSLYDKILSGEYELPYPEEFN